MNSFIVDTSDTYYLDRIYNDIDKLCSIYKNILSEVIIGKSVEGRDIVALKLSSRKDKILRYAQNDTDEAAFHEAPSVLIVGGIHAREDFSVMLCMKMIDYYCNYYMEAKSFDGFDVKNIIDKVTMYYST